MNIFEFLTLNIHKIKSCVFSFDILNQQLYNLWRTVYYIFYKLFDREKNCIIILVLLKFENVYMIMILIKTHR